MLTDREYQLMHDSTNVGPQAAPEWGSDRYGMQARARNGVCLMCRLWPCCCETVPSDVRWARAPRDRLAPGVYCGRPGCTSC